MEKSVKLTVLACALLLTAALCGAAQSGAPLGREDLPEYYAGLLAQGIITEAEYAKLESYDFALPESEKEPIDDFAIGDVAAGVNAHGVNTHGVNAHGVNTHEVSAS